MIQEYWKHLWGEMSEPGRRTFPWDLVRGMSAGAVSSVPMAFALLVAIQFFEATILQKSIIAGAHACGLLLSLFYASWSPLLGRKTVRVALPAFVVAAGLLIAAAATGPWWYAGGLALVGVFGPLPAPVMTAIYRENYSGAVRGQVFGVTMFAAVAAGLVVQGAGGGLLEFDLRWYRGVFTGLALVAALSGYCVLRIPDLGEREPARPNPLTSFGAVLENPRFGFVLVAWFLFGFANLALQPQRIEYLSQPKYGIELSPGMVVLVATFTTEATRLVVVPIFARLFDRVNFMYLRMSLNSFCLAYIIIYYNTTSLPLLMLASAFLGLMFGGGAIAWNLWVTKFAPPSETARYMSVHTFLNGVRGTIAPLVGYIVVEYLSIRVTSWIAAGLVTASLVVLWRIRAPRQTPASE